MATISSRISRARPSGAPALACGIDDRVDALEDVAELGLDLQNGARALLARLPGAQRVLAELAALEQQLPHLVLVAAHQRAQRGAHLRLLRRVAPQHVLEKREVLFADGGAAAEQSTRSQRAERLPIATVRGDDLLPSELAPQVGDVAQHRGGNRQLGGSLLQLGERRERKHRGVRRRLGLNHAQEAEVLLHVADHEAHQESVVERGELVLFGKLVGGAEQRQQRHGSRRPGRCGSGAHSPA